MRTPEEVEQLIERNQEAYAGGWLQPDQFAYNVAALSAELEALAEGPAGIAAFYSARQA